MSSKAKGLQRSSQLEKKTSVTTPGVEPSIEADTFDRAIQFGAVAKGRVDVAIVTLDAAGCVATWNGGAEWLYGYTSQDIVGRHYSRFFGSSDLRRKRPQELLELAALERVEERGWRVRKDGSRFWAQFVLTAQQGERGELLGFVSESHDLTDSTLCDPRVRDSDAQLRAFLKNGPAGMFVKDTAGRYLHVNDQFVREFGLPRDTVLGATDTQVFSPDMARGLKLSDTQVLTQGTAVAFKQRHDCDHHHHTNLISKFPIQDETGKIIGIGGTVTDITEQLLAADSIEHQAVRQSLIAAFGQFALQNPEFNQLTAEAVATIEKGVEPEFCRYLALAADEIHLQFKAGFGWEGAWAEQLVFDSVIETENRFSIGARETLLIEDYIDESGYKASPIIQAHGIRSAAEVLVWGANGPYGLMGIYSRAAGAFGQDSVDFLKGIKNTLAAAIDRKRAEDRVAYLAQFDALTGLPNRNLYIDRLWQSLRQTDREEHTVGVVFVDVDRFKAVNDKLGHSGGDNVLRQVAGRLQECIRPGDTVARLTGDEFALVLDHMAKPEDASLVADRLIRNFVHPFRIDGHEVYVTVSLGISISPTDGSSPDSLLKSADMAMYRAKQAGRNTYRYFLPDMNARAAERLLIETELRGALDRHEFVLYYQPKADIQKGTISGFEALLRWKHPKRGIVAPTEFIPILEDTGLINSVGQWVVREACEQIRKWQLEGLRPCPVAVNLSARQFNDNNLDISIGKILEASRIDPNLLELELTESVLMSDSEDAVQVLGNLKKYGIRLSVDDFGTGYSSLAYLRRFPLDALKIDRAFIHDITTDHGDATIAKAIINLAHSLKLKVVAEGVETQAQLDFLRNHACDEMQGFLFARPMPAADCARALVDDWRLPSHGNVTEYRLPSR